MRKIKGLILSLLFVAGCQATATLTPQLEILDPFPASTGPFATDWPATDWPMGPIDCTAPTLVSEAVDSDCAEPIEPEPAEPELDEPEFSFEPDAVKHLSEAEQAELLAQNQWSKNIARIGMLDTGRTLSPAGLTSDERQRRDQMNRLNMSDRDRAARQNRQFEYIDGNTSDWRWMHRGVDKIQSVPPEYRASPRVFLRAKYKDRRILQANAAILWGRDGDSGAARLLIQLVQSESVHLSIRCAAAEVLGQMPTVPAEDLIALLANVKDREIEAVNRRTGEMEKQHQPGIPELWEELLIAVAKKIPPWEHHCFLEPFYAPTGNIRLAAARIWRQQSLLRTAELRNAGLQSAEQILPEQFLEIARREGNPTVRVEIIRTLAVWEIPDLFRFLENDLRHPVAEVRNAAMIALADNRSREAIPFAKNQLRESIPANRAAAVSALRKIGEYDEVFKLADDSAAVVRVEVARALAERCTPQTANLAKTYIADRNRDVQRATLESVAGWSVEEAGPIFLAAAASFHTDIRHRAVDMLAQRGVVYTGFDPESRPEIQTVQHQALVDIFREKVGVDPGLGTPQSSAVSNATAPDTRILDEVRRCLDDWPDRALSQSERQMLEHRLKQHGQRLMPTVDYIMTADNRRIPESLDRVFAEVDPMFREIITLRSDDVNAKRNAARELARQGGVSSPSRLAAMRIMDLTARENDPMVLMSLLSSLQNADPELVCELARPLLRSESPNIRRMSCEMLMQFGSSEDIPLLHDALHDPSGAVVRGALRAVDYLWDESVPDASVLATLRSMLLHNSDVSLQVDVASTLHRLGQSEGTEALRRFSASNDYRVKVQVARRIAESGDETFVPILLRYLDDGNATVRVRALEGLPTLVGQDIGRNGVSSSSNVAQTQQQIDAWKVWGRERSGR